VDAVRIRGRVAFESRDPDRHTDHRAAHQDTLVRVIDLQPPYSAVASWASGSLETAEPPNYQTTKPPAYRHGANACVTVTITRDSNGSGGTRHQGQERGFRQRTAR
jgi:hypothetical protein